MASSTWLRPEAQSSTSQAHNSVPVAGGLSDALPTSSVAPYPPHAASSASLSKGSSVTSSVVAQADQTQCANNTPPALYHRSLPTTGNTSGSPQQSSSNSVPNSNVPAASVLQPPVPAPSPSAAPSFSYNVSHTSGSFPSSQQLTSNTGTPSSAASLQPPVPGQLMHANYFPFKTAASLMPPPKGVSSNAATFTFNGSPQLAQKDQPLKSATSAAVTHEGGARSSASPLFHSVPVAAHASSSTSAASTSVLGPSNSWVMPSPSFSGLPGTPGPPGIVASVPVSSHLTASSSPLESSAVARPNMVTATSILSGPSVQQHVYTPYPSLPYGASPHQGPWLQPPQMNGMPPRPPFLTYPPVFPRPFPLPARGMPLPSVPLPDSQPSGITPVGDVSGTTLPSLKAGNQFTQKPEMQPDLSPPGIDNSKQRNDMRVNGDSAADEQSDAWTAHKTDTGAVYYYNALTGESTYSKPPGFKGQSDEVTVQPAPVTWDKLFGTDWALVTTNVGKKYYYNTKTKLSSWQIPSEVAELRKNQETVSSNELCEQSLPAPGTTMLTEKVPASTSLIAPAINTGGRDAATFRISGGQGSTSALDLIKKKLQDSGSPVMSSPMPSSPGCAAPELNVSKTVDGSVKGMQSENNKDKVKDVNGDGNLSESSSDSEDADSGPTEEERITKFKEMLKERGVAPFSKWEKELPKIVFDPRFKAVPSYSVRRSLFEHYVKTRAEEERKEKRAAQKAAIEGFKQLLEEAAEQIDHSTDYHTFRKKWGKDPRFEALDRKEQELLLAERVIPLKRASEEKAHALRAAAASGFKSMLQEKGDITINTRWSRVKDSLRYDPRYRLVKHEDRELLFNEYIAELKGAAEEAERLIKAKREEQDKLKERERELRKRKEREEQEMERVRLKVRRKEAVSSFQALLMETIKDPQASLSESIPKLEKDPQGRAANTDLDSSDKEKLFREHIKMLLERCMHEYKALLYEVLTVDVAAQETEDGKTALTSWSTAKRLLNTDPRYTKAPRKERELLWSRYANEMQRKLNVEGDDKQGEPRSRGSVDSLRSSRINRERR